MKLQFISGVVFALVLVVASSAYAQQSAGVLLQSGLYKEDVNGDLEAAIAIYERVLKEFPKDRPVAAKALLHIGSCYEKLGKREAQKAYQRLIKEFADQPEPVARARARLAALQMDPSGMTIRRVWTTPDAYPVGVVSADGRYFTVLERETGALAIRDLTTGESRRLTHKQTPPGVGSVRNAHISPDGRQVAYRWRSQDGPLELRLVGTDGSEPRVLLSDEELAVFDVADIDVDDWSPDAKTVLTLFDKKDGTIQIATVSVMDGSMRVLKSLNRVGRGPRTARFSPDGRYIAHDFQPDQDSSQEDIFLLASDGSWGAPLVEHPADDDLLEWTPDGKAIVFRSDRRGTDDLWVVRVADGKPQGSPQLLVKNTSVLGRGMTSQGSLYYAQSAYMFDVYVATLDPGTGQVVIPPRRVSERFVGNTMLPEWSPDGEYVAYVIRSESGPDRIAIRHLRTGEERYFSQEKGVPYVLRWSPDGRSILTNIRGPRKERGLYRMDVKTGHTVPIVPASSEQYPGSAEWSPDGTGIFYVWVGANGKQILRRNLQTGQESEVYAGTFGGLALSPEGQNLAFFSAPGEEPSSWTSVQVIPAGGGQSRELFRVEKPERLGPHRLEWTPDGRHLLFGKRRPAEQKGALYKTELWRISLQGGKAEKQGLVSEGHGILRMHPDGRQVAFDSVKVMTELWVIENFLPKATASK
jgi:Tol biopolymer transport system component